MQREYLHGILVACAARPCVHAPIYVSAPPDSLQPLRSLANALEEMLR